MEGIFIVCETTGQRRVPASQPGSRLLVPLPQQLEQMALCGRWTKIPIRLLLYGCSIEGGRAARVSGRDVGSGRIESPVSLGRSGFGLGV